MHATSTSKNQKNLPGNFDCSAYKLFFLVIFPTWLSDWWKLIFLIVIVLFLMAIFFGYLKKRKEVIYQYPSDNPAKPKKGNKKAKVNGTKVNPSVHQQPTSIEDPFVSEVRQIIENHLTDQQFNIKVLCRHLGMSHTQLHRKIRAATGRPASKLIKTIRINKAKSLLENPELTITAVAYDSGFNDPDYFYRVFKREVGLTPTQYRDRVGH